jgi:hypothetical protein
MTQGNSRGATGVAPGTADASAYAPLRQPVFRALWIASLAMFLVESWVDHLRQPERVTDEEGALLAAARRG